MIRLVLTPGIKHEQEFAWVEPPDTAAWSDRHLGRVILAKYELNEPGADVYISRGNYSDEEITDEVSEQLIKNAFFQKHLIPFASLEVPILLPDRRPSVLKLTAHPVVVIDKYIFAPEE